MQSAATALPMQTAGKRPRSTLASSASAEDKSAIALTTVVGIYNARATKKPCDNNEKGPRTLLKHVILRAIAYVLSKKHDFALKREETMFSIFMKMDYDDFSDVMVDLCDDDRTNLCSKLVKAAARGRFCSPQGCAGVGGIVIRVIVIRLYFVPALYIHSYRIFTYFISQHRDQAIKAATALFLLDTRNSYRSWLQ